MAKCKLCNKDSPPISSCLSLCVDCIRNDFKSALPYIQRTHAQARKAFNLPPQIPHDPDGKRCSRCVNACQVGAAAKGYCGLPIDARLEASLTFYYDALPTNCVADWVCAGSADVGYKNLAVFYNACSFDCLFCQNWNFKEADLSKKMSAQDLARRVDERTACICYFGGDLTPQLPHSILASRIAGDLNKARTLRICWETNGSLSSQYLQKMVRISLESGGCIKFDLKAWTESLHIALCGSANRQTLENIKLSASFMEKRLDPALIVVSTLLVPGYVDLYEIEKIAGFLADINPEIPYSLLAFHPHFLMIDLPTTSAAHAQKAKEVCLKTGLKNVRIGNVHLLSEAYTV
jgi:pyruvate formate lyase activating enzyme